MEKTVRKTSIGVLALISAIMGATLTLVSGLFANIPEGLIGVGYWGYPLAWFSRVVYPNAPRIVIWRGLIVDLLTWSLLAFVILMLVFRRKRA